MRKKTEEEAAEINFKQEKEDANQNFEKFIYEFHGRYINEEDFLTGKEGY